MKRFAAAAAGNFDRVDERPMGRMAVELRKSLDGALLQLVAAADDLGALAVLAVPDR